jgi:two-component system sensor histidine kinase RpfC
VRQPRVLEPLVERLRGRSDPDRRLALLRLAVALPALACVGWLLVRGPSGDDRLGWALAIVAVEVAMACALLASVDLRPGRINARRVLGMLGDYGAIAGLMTLYGRELAPLYVACLWLTIFIGRWFGPRLLAIATGIACASFALVALVNPWWRSEPYLASGLLLGLLTMPLLLRRALAAMGGVPGEVRQDDESGGRLLADLAHELRPLLQAVSQTAEVLAGTRLSHEQRECVETMRGSARSALLLLDDSFDVAGRGATRTRVPFRLREVLRDAAAAVRPIADGNSIRLEGRCADEAPDELAGDARTLRQALVRLLHDAVRSGTHGTVTLSVSCLPCADPRAARLRFEVVHDGCNATRPSGARNSDAGAARFAALAAALVERLGGRLARDGDGTRAGFDLAFPPPGAAAVQPEPGHGNVVAFDDPFVRHRARVRPLRVLVADDHAADQLVLRRLLERAGHRPEVVGDADSLLDRLADGGYDAVVLDLHLPGTCGIELVRHARHLELGSRRTPLIALATDISPETRRRALQAGVGSFLGRPLVAAELLDALAAAADEGAAAQSQPAPRTVREAVVLDETVLAELAALRLGGDFVQQFVDQCLRDAARCLADLEACALQADWDGVRDACQAAKGVAGNMGATQLSAACDEGLRPARHDLPRTWQSYLRALHDHLARVRQRVPGALQRLREQAPAGDRGGNEA